ncbi:4'-phosphopantetheinyl transferase family protein [Streptomyces sp. NPDC054961]
MIEELLPAAVVARETFGDLPDSLLYEEERVLVADSVDQRRREFATVRGCARQALESLGVPSAPILPGPRGAPGWPDGIVGSMTHCAGYRAAAVARSADVASIGIDAEPNEPMAMPGMVALVTLPEERRWISSLTRLCPEVSWDRLVFSAKESVYKLWYPLTGLFLDFDDAVISVDPNAGTFSARLLVPGLTVNGEPVNRLGGRWATARGLLITVITLPAVRATTADTNAAHVLARST